MTDRIFHSDVARVALERPAGWYLQGLETVAKNRANVKLMDEQAQQAIQSAAVPLFIASKHPEPYDALNPTAQALVRPLGQLKGTPATDIMKFVQQILEPAFVDFRLEEEAHDVIIGGLPGARSVVRYTVQTQDELSFPTRVVLVVVPRGSFMYQFSLSGSPEGADAVSSVTVSEFFQSVRFLE